MSNNEKSTAEQSTTLEDDEPDDWDKRIFSTGCSALEARGLQSLRPTPSILSYRSNYTSLRAQSTTSTSTSTPANKPTPRPTQTLNTPKSTPSSPSPSTSTTASSSSSTTSTTSSPTTPNIAKTGLADKPPFSPDASSEKIDWTRSFHGISSTPFSPEIASVLLEEVNSDDVEIKPDGIVYLPEIKYRRILNKAFGPGGWGLVPRSESIVTPKMVTRELVSIARGEQDYFNPDGIPTATEGCKSNALVRCCKDLGVASELWDPRWIRRYKAEYTKEVFVEHVVNKRKSKIWIRKDEEVGYPWKVTK
ncbi:uncharacterized protein BHQ10_004440 [Talaromyces amestolkiae]|uniref:Mitochondrial genome maintenance protein MGM101 n=1 Tax=Talaromyces amestolkiae TaxID=1196081 RepID=A0A364KY02_TALAM|nr:uncharacterized protein BHQ10_004440 [Talaromyces amestolkiae]RAO68428.1 hypothetical protein BHQ10_004440 [Talaromyces amestolkiae]